MSHHQPYRQLFILRHAKSDWDREVADFGRPLNARGGRDAANLGKWLHTQAFHTDSILSSPARRAAQTAEALCNGTGIAPNSIQWDERLYLASLETLLKIIHGLPADCHSAMLIGHNPGLEDLLLYLTRDADRYERRGKLLTTATFAQLRFTGDWGHIKQHDSELLRFVRPRDLPETSDT